MEATVVSPSSREVSFSCCRVSPQDRFVAFAHMSVAKDGFNSNKGCLHPSESCFHRSTVSFLEFRPEAPTKNTAKTRKFTPVVLFVGMVILSVGDR